MKYRKYLWLALFTAVFIGLAMLGPRLADPKAMMIWEILPFEKDDIDQMTYSESLHLSRYGRIEDEEGFGRILALLEGLELQLTYKEDIDRLVHDSINLNITAKVRGEDTVPDYWTAKIAFIDENTLYIELDDHKDYSMSGGEGFAYNIKNGGFAVSDVVSVMAEGRYWVEGRIDDFMPLSEMSHGMGVEPGSSDTANVADEQLEKVIESLGLTGFITEITSVTAIEEANDLRTPLSGGEIAEAVSYISKLTLSLEEDPPSYLEKGDFILELESASDIYVLHFWKGYIRIDHGEERQYFEVYSYGSSYDIEELMTLCGYRTGA